MEVNAKVQEKVDHFQRIFLGKQIFAEQYSLRDSDQLQADWKRNDLQYPG